MKMNNLRKMGGVVALLASVLAVSDAASAINLTISQSIADLPISGYNYGQSFINDPSGTGASIKLNDWTFAFNDAQSVSDAQAIPLNIYLGEGDGGTLVGSSTHTSLSSFGGSNSVKWTFTGGLSLTDNLTYTAVYSQTATYIIASSTPFTYPNGALTGSPGPGFASDTVFQANFSAATPVPFEFEPTGGLLVLGGGWLLRRHLKKKKSTKV